MSLLQIKSQAINMTTPIAMITPFKAKVRDVKSGKGEFGVFSFTLADKEGDELRVSAFGDVAERLHQKVLKGQVKTVYLSSTSELSTRSPQAEDRTSMCWLLWRGSSIRWTVYDVKPVPYSEYLKMLRDTTEKTWLILHVPEGN
uniref:OB domain-containing protein n=1 Tax=Steinernema glaseri TaxID=37863 RepID=A0A1I8ASI2_9BILA